MRLSTRNQLPGTVESVQTGEAMAIVKVILDGGHPVTASITREAVDDLQLAKGTRVTCWSSPRRSCSPSSDVRTSTAHSAGWWTSCRSVS